MRFYKGAHDYLHTVGREVRDTEEQCLYLVPEASNEFDSNAVMLHNGKIKLGSVAAESAAKVRRIMADWKAESAKKAAAAGAKHPEWADDVIVVRMAPISSTKQDFAHVASLKVYGKYRINERLARKFSDKHRKE